MSEWNTKKLAGEVRHVAVVKLGFPLRGGAQADQLLRIAEDLAGEPEGPSFRVYEEAIRPSIDRLGLGPLGTLARIEFGLTDDSKGDRFWHQRRKRVEDELRFDKHLIDAMAKKVHEAIAHDLVRRWEAMRPPEWEVEHPPERARRASGALTALGPLGLDPAEADEIRRNIERPEPAPPVGGSFAEELEALAREKEEMERDSKE